MKFPLKQFLLLAVGIGLAACDSTQKLPEPHTAATEFFQEIAENRFQDAYDNTTFSFQAQTSYKSFQSTAKELGLASITTVSCNWTKEEKKDRDVKLTGEVVAASGSAVPIIITLIPERGAWRVFSLHTPGQAGKKEEDRFSLVGKGDAFNRSANHELPTPNVIQKLLVEGLTMFNSAIRTRDFHDFYTKVSKAWQDQLTEKQLQRAFQPFIDANLDIGDVLTLQPVLDPQPAINSDGILSIIGRYEVTRDAKLYRVNFNLRFCYEFPQWKLYAVEVQIKD